MLLLNVYMYRIISLCIKYAKKFQMKIVCYQEIYIVMLFFIIICYIVYNIQFIIYSFGNKKIF